MWHLSSPVEAILDLATINTFGAEQRHEHCPHSPSASTPQQKGPDGTAAAGLWAWGKENLFPTGSHKRLLCPHRKTCCSVHIRKLGYPRTTLTLLLLPIFSEWKRQASVMLHPPPAPPLHLQKRVFSVFCKTDLCTWGWGQRTKGKLFIACALRLGHRGQKAGLRSARAWVLL